MQQSSQPNQRTARTFNIDANDENEQEELIVNINDEEDCLTLECENYTCTDKPERLVRVKAEVELNGVTERLPMLIDCGATASFINPAKLSSESSKTVSNFLNFGTAPENMNLKRIKLTMKSALIAKTIECAVAKINFSIGEWNGVHEFIFADVAETAILGLDFWRKNEAKLDFEANEISIRDNTRRYTIWRAEHIKTVTISNAPARLSQTTTIKPFCEQIIRVRVPVEFETEPIVMFEPTSNESNLKRGIIMASSVSNVSENRDVLVSVINTTEQEVQLKENSDLGTLRNSEAFTIESKTSEKPSQVKPNWQVVEINPKLKESNKTELINLLSEFKQVFQWNEYECERTDLTEHTKP